MKVNPLLWVVSGLVFVNAHLTFAQNDSTKIKDNVSGVWTVAKSPYFVTGDITLPANNTLEIRPGVQVLFMGHYRFNVIGLLRAVGKPDSMILFDGATPVVKWNAVRFNRAHDSCLVKYSQIQNGAAFESSTSGGGMSIIDCSPRLSQNIIRNNRADLYGGGLYIVGRTSFPIVEGNQILENTAFDGGGIFINDYSSPRVTNNLIAGNGALSNGDGIYIDYFSTPSIINNTIVNNNRGVHRTPTDGIFLYNAPVPKILNNIIVMQECGIAGLAGSGSVIDYNAITFRYSSCSGINYGQHNISANPRFFNPDCDYRLQSDSPCIDTGDLDTTYCDPPNPTRSDSALAPARGTRRNDIGVYGGPSAAKAFVNSAPLRFSLFSPNHGDTLDTLTPAFRWYQAKDLNSCERVSYILQIDSTKNFSTPRIFSDIVDTLYNLKGKLTAGATYYWKVIAVDTSKLQTSSKEVFKFTISKTTAVEETNHSPTFFFLAQNYPNPFNPSTTIEFSLLRATHVKLKVFDLLGKEITTLVDEELAVGRYKARWDAIGVESGEYFYQLRAGTFVQTKKLLLLK